MAQPPLRPDGMAALDAAVDEYLDVVDAIGHTDGTDAHLVALGLAIFALDEGDTPGGAADVAHAFARAAAGDAGPEARAAVPDAVHAATCALAWAAAYGACPARARRLAALPDITAGTRCRAVAEACGRRRADLAVAIMFTTSANDNVAAQRLIAYACAISGDMHPFARALLGACRVGDDAAAAQARRVFGPCCDQSSEFEMMAVAHAFADLYGGSADRSNLRATLADLGLPLQFAEAIRRP